MGLTEKKPKVLRPREPLLHPQSGSVVGWVHLEIKLLVLPCYFLPSPFFLFVPTFLTELVLTVLVFLTEPVLFVCTDVSY
jgi:hypothetical protein